MQLESINSQGGSACQATGRGALRALASSAGFWSLADQGVASLGMFTCNILLGRELPQADYGMYSILLGLMLLLNGVHAGLVTYPLSVRGAVVDAAALGRYAGDSLLLTALLSVPTAIGAVAATALAGEARVVWLAFSALLVWQLQETLRRGLLAHLGHRRAIWGDAVSYLGQAALLWIFTFRTVLSLELAFGVMAATSAVGAVIQAVQLRIRVSDYGGLQVAGRAFWQLGQWLLLANVANAVSIHIYPWTLALRHGAASAASFQAVVNLLGACNPVLFGLSNLVVPGAARALRQGGIHASWRWTWRHGLSGAAVVLLYLTVLAFRPRTALTVVYGSHSPYLLLETPLRLLVVAYLFALLPHLVGAFLAGVERTRDTFAVQASGAAATLVAGVPITLWLGVTGACVGMLATGFVRAIMAMRAAFRLLGSPGADAPLPRLADESC